MYIIYFTYRYRQIIMIVSMDVNKSGKKKCFYIGTERDDKKLWNIW